MDAYLDEGVMYWGLKRKVGLFDSKTKDYKVAKYINYKWVNYHQTKKRKINFTMNKADLPLKDIDTDEVKWRRLDDV